MLPRPEARNTWRCAAFSLLFTVLGPGAARAAGYLDSPAEEESFRPFFFHEAGLNLNSCPHIGSYYEFGRSWQAGLEVRSWIANLDEAYDLIPEVNLRLRKLWLGSEERESLRNSEYVDLAVGMYPAYQFLSFDQILVGRNEPRIGPRPQVLLSLGKYWMPLASLPGGLNLSLTLGHFFLGHPPGYPHAEVLTAAFSLFYIIKKPPGPR
jgi:hypothetical protein